MTGQSTSSHLVKTLQDFCSIDDDKRQDSEDLTQILKYVAETGDSQTYKWNQLRQLITFKVRELGKKDPKLKEHTHDQMQTEENDTPTPAHPIAERVVRHLQLLDNEPPFTLQRICELLIRPEVYTVERTLWNLERCTKGITISIESFKEQSKTGDDTSPIGMSNSLEQQFDAMIDEQ